jgi:hypothetical protein
MRRDILKRPSHLDRWFSCLTKHFRQAGNINPWKPNWRKTRKDGAAVLDALANNPISSLELLKQVYIVFFLHVISLTPTMYRYIRNCLATLYKIAYNFVNGHNNNNWLIHQTFSQNVLFADEATFTIHGQVNIRNAHWTRDGFDK